MCVACIVSNGNADSGDSVTTRDSTFSCYICPFLPLSTRDSSFLKPSPDSIAFLSSQLESPIVV